MNKVHLSIVIPVYNESESISGLLKELINEIDGWCDSAWEAIVVDDGSIDGTALQVEAVAKNDSRIRLVKLKRNFGQTAALVAGIDTSCGDVIVTIDGDGQNDPKDIKKVINGVYEGYDCVSGWRKQRHDKTISRVLPSLIANAIIRRTSGIPLHDFGCSLKAYNAEVIKKVPLYGDMHRLVPFYIHQFGGSISEVIVNHRPRLYGKSKYGLARVFRVVQDILVARINSQFLTRPMHLFGNITLLLWALSLIIVIIAIVLKFNQIRDFTESPLLLVSGFMFLTGIQLLSTGLVSEMILRKMSFDGQDQIYSIEDDKKRIKRDSSSTE